MKFAQLILTLTPHGGKSKSWKVLESCEFYFNAENRTPPNISQTSAHSSWFYFQRPVYQIMLPSPNFLRLGVISS